MAKYRIAIQKVDGNSYKHIHNIMLETNNEEELIKKIRKAINNEIEERLNLLMQWINSRQKNFIQQIIEETDKDLIDWDAKGKDISREEYLANEIWHEVNN